MNQATMTQAGATPAEPQITSAYPDGVIWWVPYALGVRAPYDPATVTEGSPEEAYDQAYGHGAYDTSIRVGLGGLAVGAIAGTLATFLLMRKGRR